MKKRILSLSLILLVLTAFIYGCTGKKHISNNQSNDNKDVGNKVVKFTDDLGRSVEVKNPKRVATMNGSFTDIWNLSGGTVVATTSDSWTSLNLDLPDDVINIGSLHEPNVEQLISANPDFVIASSNLDSNIELENTLKSAGIQVAYFDIKGFDDYLRMMKICTDITGNKENYKKYGTDVEKQIASTLERVDGSKPTILFLRSAAGKVSAKNSESTVGTEMLKDLGCINIADSDNSLLEELSMEAIIKRDPDYIFVVPMGDSNEAIEEMTSNPSWKSLTAVKEGHFYNLDKKLYNSKPNDEWGVAYENLADIIYGKK